MPHKDGKMKELLDFLDNNAFDPIINKNENDFKSEDQKNLFRKIRRNTESEKERFHSRYHSAEEIKTNYLSDLTSSAAKRIDPQIESLHLPSLPQFRDNFLKLCEKLKV